MADANIFNVNAEMEFQQFGSSDAIAARLSDADRKVVDYLLEGEQRASGSEASPMAQGNFMERVNSVRRFLGLLDAMPSEEPSPSLLEKTLAKLPKADQG